MRRHVCIFAHGIKGGPSDWQTWLDYLATEHPEWILRPLSSLESHVMPVFGKGLDELAVLAANEILEALSEADGAGGAPLILHCVGHSMGGLVLRGALPAVFAGAPPGLRAGTFVTLSSPNLGIQASWGAPQSLWRNLAKIGGLWSNQLPQLAVQDGGVDIPYLVALSEPRGRYVAALRRFRLRVCATMAASDPIVPTASGAIWADRPWPRPELPEGTLAGWGFEALSSHAGQGVPESGPEGAPPGGGGGGGAGQLAWTTCADDACAFPRQVLEGLQTLSWQRLAVRLRLPGAAAHVFLIGKRSEQGALEHDFSRACVGGLAEALVQGAEGSAPQLPAPGWVRTLDAVPCSRQLCCGRWVVATEEGIGMVLFYAFGNETEAACFFDLLGGMARILFGPDRHEVRVAGANPAAFGTIRGVFDRSPAQVPLEGKWIAATEEGAGNVRFYCYDQAADAERTFDMKFVATSRILFDPRGEEIKCAGWNAIAHSTIRRTYTRER